MYLFIEPQSTYEKKVYSKSFLLSIQNATICQKKHVMLNNEWDHLAKLSNLDLKMKLLKVRAFKIFIILMFLNLIYNLFSFCYLIIMLVLS